MKNPQSGLKRLLYAARYSWKGFKSSWQSEAAVRQEVCLIVALLPVALWVPVTPAERALLILSLFLILIVELLNTGLETIVDRIGPEFHELSGKAKDVGSAAVLMTLIGCTVIWTIILLPMCL